MAYELGIHSLSIKTTGLGCEFKINVSSAHVRHYNAVFPLCK